MDIVVYSLCKGYTDKKVSSIVKGMEYKGSVDTYDNLPITGNRKGYVYTVSDTHREYVWSSDNASGSLDDWEQIGVSLTDAQQSAIDSGITSEKVSAYDGYSTNKQDSFTIGNGLKLADGSMSVDISSLSSDFEGDDFIVVDLDESNSKIKVSLDTDYQPHVVELSGTSGTLSDSDYMKLCGSTSSYTAIILLNERFYTSTTETEDYDTYTCVSTINSVTNIGSITIQKTDGMKGEWAYTNEVCGNIVSVPLMLYSDEGVNTIKDSSGNTITFSALHSYISSYNNSVTITSDENVRLYFSYGADDTIEFTQTYVSESKVYLCVITMKSDDTVTYEQKEIM